LLLTQRQTGRDPGAPRASRQEIQLAVRADPRFKRATKQEREELIEQVHAKRLLDAHGARVSHRASAQDVIKTGGKVQKLVRSIYSYVCCILNDFYTASLQI